MLKPKVIIDCGRNIGFTSLYFHNIFPDAKIISIEPAEENYQLLCKNTSQINEIVPLNYAIWGEKTIVEVVDNGLGHTSFSCTDKLTEKMNKLIGTITLKEICEKFNINNIDILKIDIEGGEIDLFKDQNLDYWLSKTKILIIELHDRLIKGCTSALIQNISGYNYSITPKGQNLLIEFFH